MELSQLRSSGPVEGPVWRLSGEFDSQTSPPSTNPQNAPLTPNRVIPLAAVRKVSAGINASPAIPMISAVCE